MIIKSMSRSTASFSGLYDYLTRDDTAELATHNLYSSAYDKEAIVKEFMHNADYLKRARGKNYLYHDIISLGKNDLPVQKLAQILQELAREYLSKRAGQHLAFSALHKDKEHMHIHLMISANELAGDKRIRLSKESFAQIQKELEIYSNKHYPELGVSKHYEREKAARKTSRKEQEMKSRRSQPSQKEELCQTMRSLFEKTLSKEAFNNALKNEGIELYTRGKTSGLVYKEKKYRLKTLGLQAEYNQMLNKLKRTKNREEKRAKNKTDTRREQLRQSRSRNTDERQKE